MTDDELNRIVDKVVDRIVDKKFNDSFINEKVDKKLSEDTRLTLIGLLEDSYSDIVREASTLASLDIDQELLYEINNNSSFRHMLSRIISIEICNIHDGILSRINDDIQRLESRIRYLESRDKY